MPAPLGADARGKALEAGHPGIVTWTNPPEFSRREGHLGFRMIGHSLRKVGMPYYMVSGGSDARVWNTRDPRGKSPNRCDGLQPRRA